MGAFNPLDMPQQDIDTWCDLRDRLEAAMIARVLIRTNSGTYSGAEAAKAVGSGDPRHADCCEYLCGDGTTYHTGPAPDRAPGVMRWVANQAEADAIRQRYRAAKAALAEFERQHARRS